MTALLLVALKVLTVAGLPASILAGARGALSKPVAIACGIAALLGTLAVVAGIIHHDGEKAGAAKVEARVEEAHAAVVADAQHDTAKAANASAAIATSTAQQTVASAAVTHYIVKELHDAIDAVPPAAPGAALPAAPVDSLRASLNTGIAGANRAADAADAIP